MTLLPDTLDGLVRLGLREALFEARTCVPAKVTSWDPDEQTVECVPLIRRKRVIDEEVVVDDYPKLVRVPVSFPRWGGFVIRMPLQAGDIVTLLISDRELEKWLAGDGDSPQTPRGYRTHSLDDAIAFPGLSTWSEPLPDLGDGELVIGREDGAGELRIRANGEVSLGSTDGPKRGIARLNDETTSDDTTDAQFWAWVEAVDVFIKAAGAAAYGQAGTVLAGALVTYNLSPVQSSQTGKITSASDVSETE